MLGRIVEVAQDQRHLSLARGFMQVEDSSTHTLLGQIPLDDIAAVIANAHGLSYTNNLLVALAERAAPFVLCAANHNAVGMLLSLDGNFEQGRRFDAQIAATGPQTKRLWAEIVKAKLQQQAGLLQALQLLHSPITALVRKVRSGDPENIEAQAARKYWSTLFGEEFRRDHSAEGINAQLNYPRNGDWTGASTQFTGFLARRDDDADCILLGGTTQLGSRETSNRACSALTQWVTVLFAENFKIIIWLSKPRSGQSPFLGLWLYGLACRDRTRRGSCGLAPYFGLTPLQPE